VSGLGADRTFQVALLLPAEGTSLVKAAQATVTVSIAPLTGKPCVPRRRADGWRIELATKPLPHPMAGQRDDGERTASG